MNRKNTETFDHDYTNVVLDKPYKARFTLWAMFRLEEKYGTVSAALRALKESPGAVADFWATILGIEAEAVLSAMTVMPQGKIEKAVSDLYAMLERDSTKKTPEPDDKEKEIDWDELHFAGRYLFKMTDDEFWNCTPRRFIKLHEIWAKYNVPGAPGEGSPKNEVRADPEAFIAALGG